MQKIYIAAIWCTTIACLLLITLFTYHKTLDNELTWDGISYLANNQNITEITAKSIYWSLTTNHLSNWHPVTWWSYMLDYQLYADKVFGYHLTNLLLHSINVNLLFFVAYRLLLLHVKNAYPKKAFLSAFIAALLFGIHPQHIESVAWVAERKDLLFLFFILLSIILYIQYTQAKGWRWYLLLLFTSALAMASKPMAVSLPIILLLLDLYPLRRATCSTALKNTLFTGQNVGLLLEKIPLFIMSIGVVILTLHAQSSAIAQAPTFDATQQLGHIVSGYLAYLYKLIIPLNLSPLYPFSESYSLLNIAANGFTLLAITFLAVCGWRRGEPWWLLGWLFYLITLLPVIGIIKVGIHASADRYAYMPILPFYIFIGSILAHVILERAPWSKIAAAISTLLIAALLSMTTAAQIRVWENEYTLWYHVLALYPDSTFALGNLGARYFNDGNYMQALLYWHHLLPKLHDQPTEAEMIRQWIEMATLMLKETREIEP